MTRIRDPGSAPRPEVTREAKRERSVLPGAVALPHPTRGWQPDQGNSSPEMAAPGPLGPKTEAPPAIASKLGFVVWTPGSDGDAGDFYCEHVLFLAEEFARSEASSIEIDASRNPMVGFLHLPLNAKPEGVTRVVAAALSGYAMTLGNQLPQAEPMRIALTGFTGWSAGTNTNPSGDFITQNNLTTAMKLAFGDALRGPPTPIDNGWSFHVGAREIQVLARVLPVNDKAISGEGSIVDFLQKTQPHALLAMGQQVSEGATDYRLESQADDGQLRHDGKVKHANMLDPRLRFPRNESLFQAIKRGWRPDW